MGKCGLAIEKMYIAIAARGLAIAGRRGETATHGDAMTAEALAIEKQPLAIAMRPLAIATNGAATVTYSGERGTGSYQTLNQQTRKKTHPLVMKDILSNRIAMIGACLNVAESSLHRPVWDLKP